MATVTSETRIKPALPSSLEGDCLCLDVRTPAEYGELHIPGSINVPLADLDTYMPQIKQLAQGKHVGLVCRSGGRAKVAFEKLHAAGIEECWVLEGGVTRWDEGGHPVRRGRKAISVERQVRIAAGFLVAAGTALGVFVDPLFLGIPAFVGCGLMFAGITDTCAMGLMLAKMPWNRGSVKLPAPDAGSCGSQPCK